MDMGVIKWNILSLSTYNQIRQDVYTFSKKDKGVVKWDMEPNEACTTINFVKENIRYKCLQVVGKSHINRKLK
jgi:hypothetical protein